MTLKNKIASIKDQFSSIDKQTEDEKLKHDEYMLMAAFLSEIEQIQVSKNINRKRLAELIKTSPSYLTQVFSGDKPLNFWTIAKIQNELNVRFEVKAFEKGALRPQPTPKSQRNITNVIIIDSIKATQISQKAFEQIKGIIDQAHPTNVALKESEFQAVKTTTLSFKNQSLVQNER
jgi:transcriptional regulator with XRE-family HTH domain